MIEKAIICSGCRKLIGEIDYGNYTLEWIKVKNAYELKCELFVIPKYIDEYGYTDKENIEQKNYITYVDAENEPVNILLLHVDSIRLFKDMKDKGETYEEMIRKFKEHRG
jgi:hypothetical protein